MRLEMRYETRAGRAVVRPDVDRAAVYDELTELRRHGVKWAEVWEMDEVDTPIDRVGGIDEIEGADDGRIRYQVWAAAEVK